MGALIEDDDGSWYYFYYGDEVTVQEIDVKSNPDVLNDMDALNAYLKETPMYARGDFSSDPLTDKDGNTRHLLDEKKGSIVHKGETFNDYRESVYVVGDFSESLDAARTLANEYERKTDYSEPNDKHKACNNKKYNFFINNCGQNTMDVFMKGKWPDGTVVEDYVNAKAKIEHTQPKMDYIPGFSTFVAPDNNMNAMQRYFGNKGFTLADFWNGNLDDKDKQHFKCQD